MARKEITKEIVNPARRKRRNTAGKILLPGVPP
jgi:hypothetical protein